MDPIAQAQTLAEVAELLYGDGAWEYVSKKSSDQEKRERTQARVGLATNVVGLTAGTAALGGEYKNLKDARIKAGTLYQPKHRGAGVLGRGAARVGRLKPVARSAEFAAKHPVGLAAAGVGLQAGNLAGDAIANRVLARSAKKGVSKGLVKDTKQTYHEARQTVHDASRAANSAANSAERIERAIPSGKKLGVIAGTTIAAGGASQYAATYYGTKNGTRAAQKPKKVRRFHPLDVQEGTIQKSFDWNATFEISKKDDDKRQVFGWASVITKDGKPVVDLQDDYMAMETIEKAAYDYVKSSRKGGDMHRRNGAEPHHVSDMIESFVVTEEKKEKLGLPPEFPTGWLVGFQVNDEDTWKLVKDGKRTQFSIHGSGQRVEKVLD